MERLVCVNCSAAYPADEILYNCTTCGHLLAVHYNLDEITVSKKVWEKRPLSVWRYRELLPVRIEPVTLQEGGTPLYHLKRLGGEMGLPHLYAKHEGMNPSGSFKDRGMTVGVSMALQLNMRSVACASTGQYLRKPCRVRCKGGDTGGCPVTRRESRYRQGCAGADARCTRHFHPREL